jgi:hypothetical protein
LPYQKGEWFVSNFVLPARNRFASIGEDFGPGRHPKSKEAALVSLPIGQYRQSWNCRKSG